MEFIKIGLPTFAPICHNSIKDDLSPHFINIITYNNTPSFILSNSINIIKEDG